ncbi:hypothetical protein SEA_NIKLAS_57 [Mycobacterium Phage Niklas]|uniref:Halobacterial output domain-containing protein n=1 Tax=Mycobacterium Phage Niklas TaxID=2517936 RepID=A0A482JHG3_9CAUD|nr:hypothetical protein I5H04_gp46 [Mycobacterium Phage Niklas]QBP31639.1 hypothetical protein SEA_NIKLAS_57 [Mycobacterium Phage Niklas]
MTDSNRPWWADREVVETWVEQKHFDATLAYLGGLVDTIEHRIAYGVDDPAVAASSALQALDELYEGDRLAIARLPFDDDGLVLTLTLGDDGIQASFTERVSDG